MKISFTIVNLCLALLLNNAIAANSTLAYYKTLTLLNGDWKLSPAAQQQGGATKKGPAHKMLNTDRAAMRFIVIGKGSTVQESLLPGTVKEMATMYHCNKFKDCSEIEARHYCAKQNQPELLLDKARSTEQVLVINCNQESALCNSVEDHVHTIRHELSNNNNHLKTSYISYKNGHYSKTAIYHFDRKE